MTCSFIIFISLLALRLVHITASEQAFHIVFTTIPVRFEHVYETINSLLNQDIPPASISIFISKRYNSQDKAPTDETNMHRFEKALAYHRQTDERYARVRALELTRDFGPIQKLLGLFLTYSNISTYLSSSAENHFIITDCDANYRYSLVQRYASYLQANGDNFSRVPTMFARGLRLKFGPRDIVHLQGVDTFLVTDQITRKQLTPRHVFWPVTLVPLIDYIHHICPDSYYQDDYVITTLFYLAGMYAESIRQQEDVYIDNSDKFPRQMHFNPKVMEREMQTKLCLTANITLIKRYLGDLRQKYLRRNISYG